MNRKKKQTAKNLAKTNGGQRDRLPLIEHLYELRRRLFIVAVSVVGGSIIAYGVQKSVIDILLRPSHGQHFIYTSPLGGINFLFSVCLDLGIAVSVPLIIYQFLRFIEPLMRATTIRFIATISVISGIVALAGVCFGYFIGLPAALNFLLHQFTNAQIKPLVTIQSYMSFVSLYLLGSALMFQLPLILIIINRIKPLKPQRLFHYERYVILFAFIVAFIMNPTPNVLDQLMVVIPIIIMYQVGIGLIWLINRRAKPSKFKLLIDQDMAARLQRLEQAARLQPLLQTPALGGGQRLLQPVPVTDVEESSPVPSVQATQVSVSARPHSYMDNFASLKRTDYQRYTPKLIQ